MLYQNSPEIKDENARKYGCFVRSLLRVPEIFSGSDFDAKELNALFERVRTLGYCNETYTVEQPGKIVEEGFRWRDVERPGVGGSRGERAADGLEHLKAELRAGFDVAAFSPFVHRPED